MDREALRYMREWASDPRALVWIIKGRAIVPEDVTSRPDDGELTEFIKTRIGADNG